MYRIFINYVLYYSTSSYLEALRVARRESANHPRSTVTVLRVRERAEFRPLTAIGGIWGEVILAHVPEAM